MSHFAMQWDPELATTLGTQWVENNFMSGGFVGVDELVSVVDSLLRQGGSVSMPSVTIAGRPVAVPS
jgi:hypothetical protein